MADLILRLPDPEEMLKIEDIEYFRRYLKADILTGSADSFRYFNTYIKPKLLNEASN